jgi:hypothetical protein
MDHDKKVLISTKQALSNFENMKKCIQGLYEIFLISLTPENIYFQMGQDNIGALYQNFLELMLNVIGTNEFMKKLQSSEIDLDLLLDNA